MGAAIKLPKLGRVPMAMLQAAILDLVKQGVSQAGPLSAKLGWANRTVVNRLMALQELGKVHRIAINGTGGLHYHWQLGPRPEGESYEDAEWRVQSRLSGNPVVLRPKSYADINSRDPLVAALFGAPKARSMQGAA